MKQATEACYRQKYDSSWQVLLPLTSDATDPAPVYGQAGILQALCLEKGSRSLGDSFHFLNDRAEALCQGRLANSTKDTLAYFYLGMCRLNRANFYAWEQRRNQAVKALMPASTPLRTALGLDPSLTDAYYGLGMIEYFKAEGDKFLLGLGILGTKESAIANVRKAAEGSGLSAVSARFSLAWMLGQEKQYPEAIKLCRLLLDRYPGNRVLLRTIRDIHYRKADYDATLQTGRELEENVLASYPENKYYLSENWLVMAKAHKRLNQPDSCLVLLDSVIAWEPFKESVPWLRTYVADAKALKKTIEK